MKEAYVGNDAQTNRPMLSIKYPMDFDIVTDWDAMEILWHNTFHHILNIDPADHSVITTEVTRNPKCNRQKISEIMFEKFNVPSMFVANQEALAIRATKQTTGLVVQLGDVISRVVPIYEGHAVQHCDLEFGIADWNINESLVRALKSECGVIVDTSVDEDVINNMKQILCYVAKDFNNEMTSYSSPNIVADDIYTMPDGKQVDIKTNKFKIAEGLFQPNILHKECAGLHETIMQSIARCNPDIQNDMLQNILLFGRPAKIPGLSNRLESELIKIKIDKKNKNPSVTCNSISSHPVWMGGSKIGASPNYQEQCISRNEYDEYGPIMVSMKCF